MYMFKIQAYNMYYIQTIPSAVHALTSESLNGLQKHWLMAVTSHRPLPPPSILHTIHLIQIVGNIINVCHKQIGYHHRHLQNSSHQQCHHPA